MAIHSAYPRRSGPAKHSRMPPRFWPLRTAIACRWQEASAPPRVRRWCTASRTKSLLRMATASLVLPEFARVEYAVSGPGSPPIRGILHYLNTWGEVPLSALPEEQALVQALRLLTSAAEFDSATGGVNREASLYPVVKLITGSGVQTVS